MSCIFQIKRVGRNLTSLREMLRLLGPSASSLKWSILSAYGCGRTWLGGLPQVDEDATLSPSGILVSWHVLLRFADEVDDLHDGLFVAWESSVPMKFEPSAVTDQCCIALKLHDSTFWQCYFRIVEQSGLLVENLGAAVEMGKSILTWER